MKIAGRGACAALALAALMLAASEACLAAGDNAAALPDVPKLSDFESVLVFLAFLIPGFISVQVYSLVVPPRDSDFSKRLNEIFAYSGIHYAAVGWLFALRGFSWPLFYAIVFLIPILWPLLLIALRESGFVPWLTKPDSGPWDRFFARIMSGPKDRGYYVRVKTKSEIVGGYYGKNSHASTFPNPRELYLETAYYVNPDGSSRPKKGSAGILINCEDAEYVLFRKL
jgi:hypothetical protein